MEKLKTTNILLLVLVLPVLFYVLKILSFIFIPVVMSMFLALLFLPLMRWFSKKNIPKPLSISLVIIIIVGLLFIGGKIIRYSTNELISVDNTFIFDAETKLLKLTVQIEEFIGIQRKQDVTVIKHYFEKNELTKYFNSTLSLIGSTVSMTLMTVFFLLLWLSESINFQKLLRNTILKKDYSSIKVFIRIENDLIRFMKVKFLISLATGVGVSLACFYFDINFPVFWGLFAFVINFIQMIGSFITVIILSLFAFLQIDISTTLLFFILSITAVQVIMGGILEPIFMGKSFSINVITILVMLSLWGYIWGIPGLIMAIPITVFLKIIFEQFTTTKILANLISGTEIFQLQPLKN
jgi:predicted PurR-regulated permease PerM